jgi:L-ascorbate metabolism protein UlaG (beta-lactamase superfamily)
MKITKFVHSCLLVEMPKPVNRTALFDPGVMSEKALKVDKLSYLDDIIITHVHADHFSVPLVKKLVAKFPGVRITTTPEVAIRLEAEAIPAKVLAGPSEGIELFNSSHEHLEPWGQTPQQIGVHYLNLLTDPGDSHEFSASKAILAMPMTAPWGSMVKAINVAISLKPKYIVPIHDWHWRDEAREQLYASAADVFEQKGITFLNLKIGEPIVLDV